MKVQTAAEASTADPLTADYLRVDYVCCKMLTCSENHIKHKIHISKYILMHWITYSVSPWHNKVKYMTVQSNVLL